MLTSLKALLLILLSLGVLLACNEQADRQVPSDSQRGKVLRPEHQQSHPNQRVALVIGNGAYYDKEDVLPNPPNDADDMAKVLKQVGFEVMLFKNLSLEAMEGAIKDFGEKLKKGGTGLFYFAGHGAQYQGENFLFPIGAMRSVTAVGHLRYRTMNVGYILTTMEEAKNNLNIVILDACRNNPFARSLFKKRGMKSRNGLALMDVPSGTLIAYATRPNQTALDGTGGRNSPYVKYLKQELPKPGLSILEVLTNVRVAVKRETKNHQAPGFYSELDKKFCFVAPCGGQVVAQTSQAAPPPTPVPAPTLVDRDKDGVADNRDKCPDNTSAEIAKGVYKKGSKIGCPMESDNDGVPDYRDKCPYNRSEELAQGVNSQGCPLDTDGDNVADYRDNCVRNTSNEVSKGVDSRGCPLDTDRDGVADYQDNCPSNARAELSQGIDSRGCPLDKDQDRVADYRDECLGTSAGVKVKPNGCPAPTTTTKYFRDRLKDGSEGPSMVWIPAGSFRMGDIQSGGQSDEKPVHRVSINRFAISRYEITVREFRQFVNATSYRTEAEKGDGCYTYKDGSWTKVRNANWRNPNFSQNDNHPVVCVSWNDANAYAKWLSAETGQKYRLLTEAEWEYAARAGTETARYWGNDPDKACSYANVHDITSKKENGFSWTHHNCTDGYAKTAPVGHFKPNNFDLFDMLGNVWEWTCSEYEDKYKGNEKLCNKHASRAVIRGGSWFYVPRYVRVAYRNRLSDGGRNGTVGFRLARP
jgi:formylglycine-generating enzyme required for sulfatase activity/uncharacterized caspase-like protein